MPETIKRRALLLQGACAAARVALLPPSLAAAQATSSQRGFSPKMPEAPIRLGIASYTFREFDRAQLLAFMKQLRMTNLNLKDMHLPIGPPEQVKAAAAELRAAGINLTAVGTVTFNKNDDKDVRAKFDYARAAGMPVIVAAPTKDVLPLLERFVREYNIRIAIHNHGPEDKVFRHRWTSWRPCRVSTSASVAASTSATACAPVSTRWRRSGEWVRKSMTCT